MPVGRPPKTTEEKKETKRNYMRTYQKNRYALDKEYREKKIMSATNVNHKKKQQHVSCPVCRRDIDDNQKIEPENVGVPIHALCYPQWVLRQKTLQI
jgi:hypothetical protein